MNDTTRRHPRTMAEAFPRTAQYGCAIIRPLPRARWLDVACWCAAVALLLLVFGAALAS